MTRKAVQKPISSQRKRKAVQNPKTSRKRKGVETPKSEKKQILDNDDLPEDIVVQILVHVPMKQVFMFISVSKRWNAILASPFFRQSYKAATRGGGGDAWTLVYNCADVLNLFHEDKFIPPSIKQFISNRKPPLYSSCGFPFENHCKIISSGHGLLLCRLSDPTVYAICDPITSRWELLPLHKVHYHEPRYKQNAIYLEAFVTKVEDPTTRSSGSISFKVIRVLPTEELLKMEIYDSMTEKWEQVETHWVPRSTIRKFQRPVCLNVSNALLDACNGKLHYAEIYGGDTVTPYIMPLWPPILKRHTRRPRKTLQT